MATNDWYAMLNLAPEATTEQIAEAVEKRSRQAASLANTAPERSQQLREQTRAIKRDLLSGDEARARYDAERQAPGQAVPPLPAQPTHYHQPAQQADYQSQPQAGDYYAQQGYATPAPRQRGSNRFVNFMRSGWTCWNCGEGALPADKFCTQCCAQLVADATFVQIQAPVTNPNACPYCGTVAASTHRYCRNCGAGRPV